MGSIPIFDTFFRIFLHCVWRRAVAFLHRVWVCSGFVSQDGLPRCCFCTLRNAALFLNLSLPLQLSCSLQSPPLPRSPRVAATTQLAAPNCLTIDRTMELWRAKKLTRSAGDVVSGEGRSEQ